MDLQNFLDVDDALQRLEVVSKSTDASEEEQKLASELLQAADQGREQ
jgi:hypothetical protein